MRKILKLHAKPILRCSICMAVAAELPNGFRCELTRCAKKFERITMLNGAVIEAN
jgi:hypothetical protein